MQPRVVGLDLSLTATGAATAAGRLFTVRPPKDMRGAERLTTLREAILATVDHEADLVVIEGPAYSRQLGAGHHEAAGLWWQIVCALHGAGIPYAVAAPTALKKYATGKGNATKADMRMALYKRAATDLRDDNQVDAWWLRHAGLDWLGRAPIPLPRDQRDALAKVTWPEAVARGDA